MRLLAVINPSAHDFEAQRRWPSLEGILNRDGTLRVVETQPKDEDTKTLIREALEAEPTDRVVAIGGDGTIHLVVNALFEQSDPPELAIIPFGTANDLAKSLELPLKDLDRLAEIACDPPVVPFDVAEVEASSDGAVRRRFFVDSVTVGMDADVLAAREKYRDKLGGYLAYAGALAERSLSQGSLDVGIRVDGKRVDTRAFNVIINNAPIYAGELTMPGARRDDGLLDVYYFNRAEYASKLMSFIIKQADILRLGVNELLEEITNNQQILRGAEAKLRLASPRRVQVDGEKFGKASELSCRIVGQLQIAAPDGKPREAPKAKPDRPKRTM